MKYDSNSRSESLTRRRIVFGGSLAVLLGAVGCFAKVTSIGDPVRIGNFSIQKFHVVSLNEGGSSTWDYFNIYHGRFFSTKLGMPPNDWSDFDRVTRLPSKSLTLLVQASSWAALVMEKNGKPVVETLWNGEQGETIQAISATRWHIPDYVRIAQLPDETYSGGHVFNGVTLTRYQLPNQPPDQSGQFVTLSPDETAVAWFRSYYVDLDTGTHSHSIYVSDAHGATSLPLIISESFIRRNTPPDGKIDLTIWHAGSSWQAWLDKSFEWLLDETHRWRLVFIHPLSASELIRSK